MAARRSICSDCCVAPSATPTASRFAGRDGDARHAVAARHSRAARRRRVRAVAGARREGRGLAAAAHPGLPARRRQLGEPALLGARSDRRVERETSRRCLVDSPRERQRRQPTGDAGRRRRRDVRDDELSERVRHRGDDRRDQVEVLAAASRRGWHEPRRRRCRGKGVLCAARQPARRAGSGNRRVGLEDAADRSAARVRQRRACYHDGRVYVGIAGGEVGVRGQIGAYDAKTGREIWTFFTVPGPGERGGDTWEGDSYKHGGGPVWLNPAIDPELGMLYVPVGNAGPDNDGQDRGGDNLFTASIVALDLKTGAYQWHFQEVHHDIWDYDASSAPILADVVYRGQ